MLLGVGLGFYALATYVGWRYAPFLLKNERVTQQLWLLTAGIWLELAFMDLIPSTQTTFLGMLGFYRATLLSIVLFFSPIFLVALGQTLRQRLGKPKPALNLSLFVVQNLLEGILIYCLYRVNGVLGFGYLLLTMPHAVVESLALYTLAKKNSNDWIWLVATHLIGIGLGYGLVEHAKSLVGLAVFKQLMAGYLVYVCLAELLPQAMHKVTKGQIPYALFSGMLLMGLLSLF